MNVGGDHRFIRAKMWDNIKEERYKIDQNDIENKYHGFRINKLKSIRISYDEKFVTKVLETEQGIGKRYFHVLSECIKLNSCSLIK